MKRKGLSKTLRAKVFKKCGNKCMLQLQGCAVLATTVEHIVPVALGGTDDLDNLIVACLNCNSKRGGRLGANIRYGKYYK